MMKFKLNLVVLVPLMSILAPTITTLNDSNDSRVFSQYFTDFSLVSHKDFKVPFNWNCVILNKKFLMTKKFLWKTENWH